MYSGNSTRPPRFSLRTTHRRPTRLAVSHREVPSAWSPASKDREPPAPVRRKVKRR
jgi:hypothetical protein